MSTVVQTRIVKIGNSQGVRIPKTILDVAGLTGKVEIEVQAEQLVIRPAVGKTREGWAEQLQEMAARGDDWLLDAETVSTSRWDEEEWEWE